VKDNECDLYRIFEESSGSDGFCRILDLSTLITQSILILRQTGIQNRIFLGMFGHLFISGQSKLRGGTGRFRWVCLLPSLDESHIEIHLYQKQMKRPECDHVKIDRDIAAGFWCGYVLPEPDINIEDIRISVSDIDVQNQ